jgi:hypothetical protein
MSFDTLGDLNWLAVIVAALAYFALGGLWYSPVLFGNQWMKAAGVEMPADGRRPGAAIYASPLIGDLVSAIATGMLAAATASTTVGEGLVLGIVVAVGYSLVLAATTATFSQNMPAPWTWFAITGAYNLVGLAIVGVIVSIWE